MKIEAITLRELQMRLKAPFETSFGVTQDRRILLVEVLADGVMGGERSLRLRLLHSTPKPPTRRGMLFPISLPRW